MQTVLVEQLKGGLDKRRSRPQYITGPIPIDKAAIGSEKACILAVAFIRSADASRVFRTSVSAVALSSW